MDDGKLRILMLSWEYPPVVVGGLGRHVHALATSLATAGHEVTVVTRHAPDFAPGTIETRPSREGKYVSLTATVNATSQEQLDALYRELCDHPSVVMVL